jgi:hypothetical protein
MKIVFSEQQIATFTEAERELFNSLKEKAKATIEAENDGFDVKAYLEKRKQKESEEDEYRKFMEDSLNGKPVTQHF